MAPQGLADDGHFGVARERRSPGRVTDLVLDVVDRVVDARDVVASRTTGRWA